MPRKDSYILLNELYYKLREAQGPKKTEKRIHKGDAVGFATYTFFSQ